MEFKWTLFHDVRQLHWNEVSRDEDLASIMSYKGKASLRMLRERRIMEDVEGALVESLFNRFFGLESARR